MREYIQRLYIQSLTDSQRVGLFGLERLFAAGFVPTTVYEQAVFTNDAELEDKGLVGERCGSDCPALTPRSRSRSSGLQTGVISRRQIPGSQNGICMMHLQGQTANISGS